MKNITLCFHVHQPHRLKTYRFFDMGTDHNYLDVARNRAVMQQVAAECYLPANNLMMQLIKAHKGEFKFSLCMSGLFIEQMKAYAPELLESFRKLVATGCVELIATPYSNSLASLIDKDEFETEVRQEVEMIRKEFGQTPSALFNTALLYSDSIGAMAAEMGFKTILTEGAKHLLGWKSPNYVYANAISQKLRILLRNYRLSDDIAFHFSDKRWCEWPLSADKFTQWLNEDTGDVVNLFMDYEVIGCRQSPETGIFDFIGKLPELALGTENMIFTTVSESAAAHQPIGVLHADYEVTWADEERDLSAWLGNELQQEAFKKLYSQRKIVRSLNDDDFNHVWNFLCNADNFYWMATKWFSDRGGANDLNPYSSSYEAFINYMNVLSDFMNELARRAAQQGKPITDKLNSDTNTKGVSDSKSTLKASTIATPKAALANPTADSRSSKTTKAGIAPKAATLTSKAGTKIKSILKK